MIIAEIVATIQFVEDVGLLHIITMETYLEKIRFANLKNVKNE